MNTEPYIIIGMHRSGTSLLAKVLEKAGIFMGVVKDHNFEAMHFLSLNQQTLWAAGADWHLPKVPEPLHWKTFPAQELYFEHFRAQYRLSRLKLRLKAPRWGWKDPRNTFTLPMWLALFPKAKVLHVVRAAEPVVKSLQTRNNRKAEVFKPELESVQFCQNLWRQYVETGRSYAQNLGARYCEITYEDLCALHPPTLQKLEHFCKAKTTPALKSLLA
jgi:hypothetical protein